MRKRITAAILFLCVAGLLAGLAKGVAYAESGPTDNTLDGSVELLRQDKENYVIQVTVENMGEDFYGTVQVVFQASYSAGNCAYNTEISLPAQGKKQFTITVPERAVDATRGECMLNFLDGRGKPVQSISLKNLMNGVASGILVGVLSDDYSSLTYMDAGGGSIYVRGDNYPLHLIQLDRDNLRGYLDGFYFLVIDQFNVSVLEEEDIQAIEQWVRDGGCLIIGTGAYAEQTLSGFGEDFLDMQVWEILEPGEENAVSENRDRYGYYSNYINWEVDFSQMTFAQLDYGLSGYSAESSENPAVYKAIDQGAAAVYFSSLGDTEMQKLGSYAVEYIYEELMYQSRSYHSFNRRSNLESAGQRMLAHIGNRDTSVDFSVLRLLIGIYVILAGPVLYLILRKCKKSEWYWVGVPALGLTFILGVFLLGRNARVNETRVYAVTAQKADEDWMDTYFLAYHSGVKPWKVLMREDYEIAGPGWNGYNGKYFSDAGDYFYTVDYDSQGLSVGEKPRENFESGFFYAGGHTQSRGVITGAHIKSDPAINGCIMGTVTNETDCDLAYMAVWNGQEVMIIENVKAGETLDLQQAEKDGRCVYQSRIIDDVGDLLLYSDIVSIYNYSHHQEQRYSEDEMAALILGLSVAKEAAPKGGDCAVIAGLIKDCGRVTAGKCKETSYECLYGYAETEV